MSEGKKQNVDAETIGRFLEQTGFVFEMRANDVFQKQGYTTEINDDFLDLEGNSVREVDVTATKVINDINVHFVVECKQSVTDKWIFICNKKIPRFYRALKHLPSVPQEHLRDKKLFANLHLYDRKMFLGHNYLCYTIKNGKKTEHIQIDECVHKLPKALVDLASRSEGGRHLFFPVALFSGQIFAVSYPGKLAVQEVPSLQYFVEFSREAYRKNPEQQPVNMSSLLGPGFEDLDKWIKAKRVAEIREAALNLATPYQIDFVTEAALRDFLIMIEKEVAAIPSCDWPVTAASQKAQVVAET